jgi:hypothetical protein
LHRVLQSHPDVFSPRKELCPAGDDEVEAATFADLLHFTVDQERNGNGTWRHLDPKTMQADCVMEFGPSSIDVCSDFYSGAGSGGSERRATVLQSCIQSETVHALHSMVPMLTTRVLYLQRDPADLFWSTYNLLQGDVGTRLSYEHFHEHFHEIVMSRGELSGGVSDWRDYMGLHEMGRLRNAFGEENVRFFRSEDLRSPPQMELLFKFVGLDIDFLSVDIRNGVTNTQGFLSPFPRARGTYAISNYRPMLCATRELIYSHARRACFELQATFGLRYPACLGEVSAC